MISHHRNFNDVTISQLQLRWQLRSRGTRYQRAQIFLSIEIFSSFVWQIFSVLAADLKHSTRRENLFGRKYLKMWSIFVSDSGGSCSCWYSVMTTISICHSWTTVRLRKCEQTITQAEDKGGRTDWRIKCRFIGQQRKGGRSGSLGAGR